MRYEIKRTDDGSIVARFKSDDFEAAKTTLIGIKNRGNSELGCYFLGGKRVSIDDAIKATDADKAAWYEKKSLTHKKVKVFSGVCAGISANKPTTKWVRK